MVEKRRRASKVEIAKRLKLLKEDGLKLCPNCEKVKTAQEFAEDKRHYDGLQTYCRECCNLLRRTKYGDKVRARAREAHHEKKDENNARAREYYYENWERMREANRRWFAQNSAHRQRYRRQYHEENREEENAKARVRMRQWVQENKERHRENCRRRELRLKGAEGEHDEAQWQELLDLCGGICLDCGSVEDITQDHIIPLIWGGTDLLFNIQPLCRSCNCKKQDHYAVDYRPAYVRQWAFLESIPWTGDRL